MNYLANNCAFLTCNLCSVDFYISSSLPDAGVYGQTIVENGKSFIDVIPSIQFIFNSQSRIDVGYRQELYSSMLRSAPNGIYLNLEYTFFNIGG
jgi:hypothetical protein